MKILKTLRFLRINPIAMVTLMSLSVKHFFYRMRRELNKQLRQQRNHIKSVIYDTDSKIDELRSKVEVCIYFTFKISVVVF